MHGLIQHAVTVTVSLTLWRDIARRGSSKIKAGLAQLFPFETMSVQAGLNLLAASYVLDLELQTEATTPILELVWLLEKGKGSVVLQLQTTLAEILCHAPLKLPFCNTFSHSYPIKTWNYFPTKNPM